MAGRRLQVVTACEKIADKCRELWLTAEADNVTNKFGEMSVALRRKLEAVVTGRKGARDNIPWEIIAPLRRAEVRGSFKHDAGTTSRMGVVAP